MDLTLDQMIAIRMGPTPHDWEPHDQSIADLEQAFPFLTLNPLTP